MDYKEVVEKIKPETDKAVAFLEREFSNFHSRVQANFNSALG